MTDTSWHDHPGRHKLGGILGVPENPSICTPGIGGDPNYRPGWRKGNSGVPAASDHSHPLEAVRMQVFTSKLQSSSAIDVSQFYAWGNPNFNFSYTKADESCSLAFQYVTTFWMRDGSGGAMFGIYDTFSGNHYWVGQFDSPSVYAGRHYKNTPADHTLAMGTIIVPAAYVPAKVSRTYSFQWQRYTGNGVVTIDGNDFAQITVMEFYTA